MGRAAAIDPPPSGLAVGVIAILVAWLLTKLLAEGIDEWRRFVADRRLPRQRQAEASEVILLLPIDWSAVNAAWPSRATLPVSADARSLRLLFIADELIVVPLVKAASGSE
jgi:hypothetical protein